MREIPRFKAAAHPDAALVGANVAKEELIEMDGVVSEVLPNTDERAAAPARHSPQFRRR